MPVLSRFSSATGFKEVFTPVEADYFSAYCYFGSPRVINKSEAKNFRSAFSQVQPVFNVIRFPQITKSVVAGVVVLMVNKTFGLLACMQKPSKAVSVILNALVSNDDIPVSVKASSDIARLSFSSADKPNKLTRIRAVFQDFLDGIGYKIRSHIALLCGLVRGLVVDATNAPILSRGISL